jgi:hypothetical protein
MVVSPVVFPLAAPTSCPFWNAEPSHRAGRPQSSADVEIRNDELWVVKAMSIDCAAGLAMRYEA